MSAEVAVRQPGQVQSFDDAQLELLKRTLTNGITNDQFQLFVQVCNRTGLDPFMRQIHAVKRGNSMSIQVGIDGYRLIADRTGCYAGSDDAEYEGETPQGYPQIARVTVWKLVAGLRVAFTASARWSEYYPGDQLGQMWRKMPHVMLAKVAEALALRKAFPAELSGLYTQDEMAQADYVDVPSRRPDHPDPVKAAIEALKDRVQALSLAPKAAFQAWKNEQGFAYPWSLEACSAMNAKLDEIAGVPGQPDGDPAPPEGSPDTGVVERGPSSAPAVEVEEPVQAPGSSLDDPITDAELVEPSGYELWSKADLVEECRSRELNQLGTKSQLIVRLREDDPEGTVEPPDRPF